MNKIPNENLISEIHYLYSVLDEVPTSTQMNARGSYSVETYYNRFGSWGNAIEQAGYPNPNATSDVPKISLVNEVHRIHDKLDKIPSERDMEEYGVYNPDQYYDLFINWEHVIQESGIKKDGRSDKQIPIKNLIAEIGRIYKIKGTVPTIDDLKKEGRYSSQPYLNTFSSWNSAVKAAGFEPKKPSFISEESLIKELRRLNQETDGDLSSTKLNEHGKYSATTYIDRFGSWEQAIEAASIRNSK